MPDFKEKVSKALKDFPHHGEDTYLYMQAIVKGDKVEVSVLSKGVHTTTSHMIKSIINSGDPQLSASVMHGIFLSFRDNPVFYESFKQVVDAAVARDIQKRYSKTVDDLAPKRGDITIG